MKRSWIGLGLLLLLLSCGIVTSWLMQHVHEPIAVSLRQAAGESLSGHWETAEKAMEAALQTWEDWDTFRTSLADHSPVEDIEAQIPSLRLYCRNRETGSFAAACLHLAEKIQAVGDAHGLVWKNIL